MTGEKEAIARAIYERRNGHGCKPWSLLPKAHKEPCLGDAEAAQALFAPILAEKERLEGETRRLAAERENFRLLYVGRDRMAEEHLADRLTVEASRDHWMAEAQRLLKAGQDTLDRMEAAEARALAAEAALAAERERAADIADMAAEREDARAFENDDDLHVAECRGAERAAKAIAAAIRAQGE